jgi:hypothetical protein
MFVHRPESKAGGGKVGRGFLHCCVYGGASGVLQVVLKASCCSKAWEQAGSCKVACSVQGRCAALACKLRACHCVLECRVLLAP